MLTKFPVLFRLITFAIVVMLASCAQQSERKEGTAIAHVVLIWLKQPGNTQHQRQIIEASKQLEAIDGVLLVRSGLPVASERSVVDDSFDVALYFELASRQALVSYAQDPVHVKILQKVIAPFTDHYIVYDFEIER
jgi:hypothetical protein